MRLSRNEFEALITRAAVGAGWPWGMAEELARATSFTPGSTDDVVEAAIWAMEGGKAPAMAALAALDTLIATGEAATFPHLGYAPLFEGFARAMSAAHDTPLSIEMHGDLVAVRRGGEGFGGPARPDPSEAVKATLEAMAARTYVPSNAQSRAAGAGAGLTDND